MAAFLLLNGAAQADDLGAGLAPSSFEFSATGADAIDLMDPAQVAEAIREAKAEYEAEIAAPRAVAERINSVDEFSDLGSNAVEDLVTDIFEEPLADLTGLPSDYVQNSESRPTFIAGTDTSVRIDPPGPEDSILVVSDTPLRNKQNQLVDGVIVKADGGFQPAAPLANVEMPLNVDGEVELSDVGVGLSFPNTNSSSGRLVDAASDGGREMVLYPNTQTDTDTAITYTLKGVETFNFLRSEESPESLSIDYSLPSGAAMRPTDDGGALIVDDQGKLLATVFPPFAVDAQGTGVPMSLSVDGSSIKLEVPHRGRDFAYPIMVDPVTHVRDWWTNGASAGFEGWTFTEEGSTNYGSSTTCPAAVPSTDPCKTGTGSGVYVTMIPGSNYPANSKAYWRWTVPGGSDSYIASAEMNTWRYREGANTYGWAFYNIYNGTGQNFTDSDTGGGMTGTPDLTGGTSSKYIHVGLMTSTSFTMPTGSSNWRYNRLAAYSASLNDQYPPSLSLSGAPTSWIGPNTTANVTANAQDTGLGLGWINATVNGSTTNKWVGWCTGTYPTPCPTTPVSQAMSFNSNDFASGINTVPIKAVDIVSGTGHETTQNITLKVDKTKPVPSIGGDIEDGDWLKAGTYTVTASATDTYSGSGNISIKLDGVNKKTSIQSCPAGGCSISTSVALDLSTVAEGPHELSVISQDIAGNQETVTRDFNIDNQAPEMGLEEALAIFTDSLGDQTTSDAAIEDLGLPGYEIAVVGDDGDDPDTASGIADVEVTMNNVPGASQPQVPLFNYTYDCSLGCEETSDWNDDVVLEGLGTGLYKLVVKLRDAAGNVSERSIGFNYTAVIPEGNYMGFDAVDPGVTEEEADQLPEEDTVGNEHDELARHSTTCEAKIEWPHPSAHNPGRVGGGGYTTCPFSGDRPFLRSWLYVDGAIVDVANGKLGNGKKRRRATAIVSTGCRHGTHAYKVVNIHWVIYHHVDTPAAPARTAKTVYINDTDCV